MSNDTSTYGIADLGVAGLMVAGWHSGDLLALVGHYVTPAVADMAVAGMTVADLDNRAANYRSLQQGSLRITDQHQGVSEASFSIKCPADERPQEGDLVLIAIGSLDDPIFSGYVTAVDETNSTGDSYLYACTARALAKDLEKRICTARDCDLFGLPTVWQHTYAGEILSAFLEAYTPHFRLWGNVEQGVYIEDITLVGFTLLDICNKLAARSNYIFYVDAHREVHFKPSTKQSAPWHLTSTERFRDLHITEDGSQLKNRISLYYSSLEERTQSFVGDGDTTVFVLDRLPYEVISLAVNGVPVSFGSRYTVDNSDHDFSIDSNNGEIHTIAHATLTSADTLTITYSAKLPALLETNHTASQSERREREGGDGIYDYLLDAQDEIVCLADAQAKADALLAQYAYPQVTASYTRTDHLFEFLANRLHVGQHQQLMVRGRTLTLTVERVTTSIVGHSQSHLLRLAQQAELGPVSKGLETIFQDTQDAVTISTPEIVTVMNR